MSTRIPFQGLKVGLAASRPERVVDSHFSIRKRCYAEGIKNDVTAEESSKLIIEFVEVLQDHDPTEVCHGNFLSQLDFRIRSTLTLCKEREQVSPVRLKINIDLEIALAVPDRESCVESSC